MSPMLAVAVLLAHACGAANDVPASIDLIRELPSAERRALGNVEEAVRVQAPAAGGAAPGVLLMRAPARVIWTLRIPARAALMTSASMVPGADGTTGTGTALRVGISDDRHYEGLFRLEVRPGEGWQSVVVDLRKYAGWQWSLFYRPSAHSWKFIVNADATPGGTLALRAPVIQRR